MGLDNPKPTIARPFLEPRSQLIIRRTQEAIRNSGLNVVKFAARVAERYIADVAATDRVVEFYDGAGSIESALHAQKRNAEFIDRIIKGTVKFPVDVEEAWVSSLPEPFRADLVRELAGRYGLTGAKCGDLNPSQHLACLADVLSDAGRNALSLAPIFADGKITPEDAPHCQRALEDIGRALADLVSLQSQLETAVYVSRPAGSIRLVSKK